MMSYMKTLGHGISKMLIPSLQAGSLMAFGDIISQRFIEKKEKFDYGRTIRFGTIGLFFVGPVLRTWYGFLEVRVALSSPMLTTAAKVSLDQCVMAPAFLAAFIVLNGLLVQGDSWRTARKDLSLHYKDILVSNYKLWPAVQAINFTLVPLQYRVLFVQTVALSWNTYLSWKTNGLREISSQHSQ